MFSYVIFHLNLKKMMTALNPYKIHKSQNNYLKKKMTCLTIETNNASMKNTLPEMNIDLDEFIVDAENFFTESEFQFQRTFTDFKEHNDEGNFMDKDMTVDYMYAPADLELVKKLIGHKGYNFISITENTGLNRIWHDRKKNVIEFQGGSQGDRLRAMSLVRNKLNYYIRGRTMKNFPVPENIYYYANSQFYTPAYLSVL